MKAVILNGALGDETGIDNVQAALTATLSSRAITVQTYMLRRMKIAGCAGCFNCWVKTPGICIINDEGRTIAKSMIRSDLLIYLTPVTFGAYSSELKKALDRMICLISPFFMMINGEVHHRTRYDRSPHLLCIGTLPRPDEEAERIFTKLTERNAVNFHCPAHAAAVVYENGKTADVLGVPEKGKVIVLTKVPVLS